MINISNYLLISTSNHMFGRVIWGKLPECIFENFNFEILKNREGDLFQNRSNEKCGYWFITPKQEILCTETNIF